MNTGIEHQDVVEKFSGMSLGVRSRLPARYWREQLALPIRNTISAMPENGVFPDCLRGAVELH